MNIQNNPQIPSTISPSFKAIKTVKCAGLYEKYPKYAEKLIYTFRNNPVAMNFCKNRDVDIVFYASKDRMNGTESSIHIFYNNPVKSLIKKFFDFINGKKECIQLSAWGNQYNVRESLIESTGSLIESLKPYNPNDGQTGVLDSHIKLAEKKYQETLAKKSKKQEEKLAKIAKQNFEKKETESAKESLKSSISKLIESSK